jgi:hypothetical protein
MLPVLIASVAIMLFAFALFSIRVLLVRNGEFKGTCANNNPFMVKQGVTCGVCGRQSGEACGKDEPESTDRENLA